jgi:hypothetical protein
MTTPMEMAQNFICTLKHNLSKSWKLWFVMQVNSSVPLFHIFDCCVLTLCVCFILLWLICLILLH